MSQHLESMGDKWFTLLKSPDLIPGVIGTTVAEGGTRPIWRIEEGERETFLMAWPRESLLRAGGEYAHMFQVQSQYYQKGAEEA